MKILRNPTSIHSHSRIFELQYYCNFGDKYLANKPYGFVFVNRLKHRLWIKLDGKTMHIQHSTSIQLPTGSTRTDEFNPLYSYSLFRVQYSCFYSNKKIIQASSFEMLRKCKNLTLYNSSNWIYRISFRNRTKLNKSGFDRNANTI